MAVSLQQQQRRQDQQQEDDQQHHQYLRFVVCIDENGGTSHSRTVPAMLLLLAGLALSWWQLQWFGMQHEDELSIMPVVSVVVAITMPWALWVALQQQQCWDNEDDDASNEEPSDNNQRKKQPTIVQWNNATVAVVSVYPLGVQLTIEEHQGNNVRINRRQFIPRDQIYDCVVTEVISSTGVSSVVVLRIMTTTAATARTAATSNSTGQTRQDDGKHDDVNLLLRNARPYNPHGTATVQLIPVFPGADMTYQECLTMRNEISKALQLSVWH